MPHADSALVPSHILTKTEFWQHVHDQLELLLEGQRNWVTNLANASSLIHNSLLAFPPHFGDGDSAVNWCGFYIDSPLLPTPRISRNPAAQTSSGRSSYLLLGPFCGKPACQLINTTAGKARGVCADAYMQCRTVVVSDVNSYPGHIACDGETKSEIVCPLIVQQDGKSIAVGVLDLDCLALDGFNEDDRVGLDRIADLLAKSCDW